MGNYLLQSPATDDPSVLLVTLLGVGVVFLGLTLLIGLVKLMNAFFDKKNESAPAPVQTPVSAVPVANNQDIPNKQELIAAVCAAIAEENGKDISAIRVISFKKIN